MLARAAAPAFALLAVLFAAPAARAQDVRLGPQLRADPRRDPAHYRGRPPATSPEEVLAMIPGVIFAPVTAALETFVRQPLVALIDWAERERVIETITLLLNPHRDVSWAPSLTIEAGVWALPGFWLQLENAWVRGHTLRLAAEMAQENLWGAALVDRWQIGPVELGVRGGYAVRPERPYFGLGPRSGRAVTRFTQSRLELLAVAAIEHREHVRAELRVGYVLDESAPGGLAPSIETAHPLNLVPGFGRFELAEAALDLTLDSRASEAENAGARFAGNATVALDGSDESRAFATFFADLEGALELGVPDRVLILRAFYAGTATVSEQPVPFTRLATLGWRDHRGFVWGRFRGESALLAELRYRYPIAYYVDLQWVASVGNVFARDLHDFDVGALTASFGVGIRTRRFLGDPAELAVAIGTDRFEEGFRVDSVRVFVDVARGL